MLDLVLRGGRVCDGSGGSAHDADVGIEAGRIVAIGRTGGAARRTLDVRGLIVAPGFVDVHTHYDAQVTWDRLCTPSCWHGVTSVVIGNCGFALAPCRPSDRERLLRMLEHVEGMPFESLCAGIAWEWESFAEYVRALGARPLGMNVGALLGHSALRAYVMGDGAYTRAARAGEVETMAALVREGMVAGALGFATSRSPAHVGEGGRPVPSRQAPRAEVDALVGAMAASGRGVLEITPETFPVSADELAWLQGLARTSRRPVSFSAILDVPDRPGVWEPIYAQLRDGLAAGAAVYPQVSCRPMRFDFDLATGCASLDAMPCWRRWRAAPSDAARLALLADADFATHLLGHWVRERGLFGWEEAVRRLTTMPAAIYGIPERGLLAPGWVADVVCFDPARVAARAPEKVRDFPGGAARYVARADGIEHVFIGGEELMARGEWTGAYPGAVLAPEGATPG